MGRPKHFNLGNKGRWVVRFTLPLDMVVKRKLSVSSEYQTPAIQVADSYDSLLLNYLMILSELSNVTIWQNNLKTCKDLEVEVSLVSGKPQKSQFKPGASQYKPMVIPAPYVVEAMQQHFSHTCILKRH
jgi:hypothetical protein